MPLGEKHLLEYLQEANTGDGEKVGIWDNISGFGSAAAKVYTENMNGNLYCHVLQHQLKPSIVKLPKIISFLPTGFSLLAHVGYCKSKNWQTKVKLTRLGCKKS